MTKSASRHLGGSQAEEPTYSPIRISISAHRPFPADYRVFSSGVRVMSGSSAGQVVKLVTTLPFQGEVSNYRITSHHFWGELCSPARSGQAFLSRNCGRMASTDEKRVTQFVVALPGPHNETERATPCSVPRRPPRTVKAATRRSRDGLRPAWTAECCARVSGHPIFLSEKMGIFQLEFRARFRVHDRHSCLYRWIGRAGYRSHRA